MGNGNGDARSPVRAKAPLTRQLSASSAHEINNPLDTLYNLLFLLQGETNLTVTAHHRLKLAREEVRRISEIAQEALRPARARAKPQETDVAALLDAVLDFYKPTLQSSRVAVKSSHSGDDNVPAYAGHLRQAFSNLLRNAMDSMPDGGDLFARVSAGHEWTGRQRRGIRITIADTGCGISSAALPNIFDRFFTTKHDGSGIGLSQVRDVVQEHAGVLRVRSRTQPGHSGTVFSMFLPA